MVYIFIDCVHSQWEELIDEELNSLLKEIQKTLISIDERLKYISDSGTHNINDVCSAVSDVESAINELNKK